MPGAELGLRLYQATGKRTYLDWSRKMYDWTNKYLLAPNGLYWDHVDLAGNIEKTQWSYNQGVPIGVNVLFYEITHDRTYLQRAESIAKAAYTFYIDQGNLAKQGPSFNAIFFKNLLLMESVTAGTSTGTRCRTTRQHLGPAPRPGHRAVPFRFQRRDAGDPAGVDGADLRDARLAARPDPPALLASGSCSRSKCALRPMASITR